MALGWSAASAALKTRLNKRHFFALTVVSWFLLCILIMRTYNFNQSPVVFTLAVVTTRKDVTTAAVTTKHRVYRLASTVEEITRSVGRLSNESSKALYHKVRVLCWVMTSPTNHKAKARHVKRTWGRRCNKLLFMSSADDAGLGAINLNVSEGRQYLWNKTHTAFRYVYEHHMDDADWFMKADDDTYVIVENLRTFLEGKNSLDPVFYGYFFAAHHASGGAGYVLSRRAVELLVEQGVYKNACPNVSTDEDVAISACLHAVGVWDGKSEDSEGLDRFNPFEPPESLLASYNYEDSISHPPGATETMHCSESAISFHYVKPGQMYALEYFIYHFHLQGGAYPEQSPVAYYF